MPKYYCDYCDAYLTHDSPSVRKTHNGGRKHKENVRNFYQLFIETQAQKFVDATTKAYKQRPAAAVIGAAPFPQMGMTHLQGMIPQLRPQMPPGTMIPGFPPRGMMPQPTMIPPPVGYPGMGAQMRAPPMMIPPPTQQQQ
uniref:U1 small nuclear ribonucleoprotein C n=1 Tax=Rhabditophanes sp. KR3021 TaxID=114890 RepID=A0AC35UEM6_9BILA